MFKMTFGAQILAFNVEAYTKTLKKSIRVSMNKAARAFIRAAIVNVPIQSGMSRGTFLNLGKLLRVAIPIPGTVGGLRYYGPNARGQIKSPALGASLSSDATEIFRQDGTAFHFHYGNDVIHYNVNDFFGHIPSAPWLSYERGAEAFEVELKRRLTISIPKLKSFVIVTKVTSSEGVTRQRGFTLGPPPADTDDEVI